jgi:hypothetical protein
MPNEIAVLREDLRRWQTKAATLQEVLDITEHQRDVYSARAIVLEIALRRARNDIEGWGGYASPYFQDKWDLADDLKAIDDVLAGV